jgi:ribonuclease VapC
MVIDTSAVLTILFNESEAQQFAVAIENDPIRLISAPNVLEAMIVIEARKGEAGAREFDLMLHKASIDIVPFNKEHAEIARIAWQKYGKGNHPASLNIGDCFAYALSKNSAEPLLFKGNDFFQTDIMSVFPQA